MNINNFIAYKISSSNHSSYICCLLEFISAWIDFSFIVTPVTFFLGILLLNSKLSWPLLESPFLKGLTGRLLLKSPFLKRVDFFLNEKVGFEILTTRYRKK